MLEENELSFVGDQTEELDEASPVESVEEEHVAPVTETVAIASSGAIRGTVIDTKTDVRFPPGVTVEVSSEDAARLLSIKVGGKHVFVPAN
jgi:hypothetical protein